MLLRLPFLLLLLSVSPTLQQQNSAPLAPTKVAVVAASACAQGQARRPCATMERASGGLTISSTCPCPYIDGVTGGPGPVRRFSLEVRNLVLPSLVAGLNKVHVTANGTIPGPPIIVNQGDWVEIAVTNRMPLAATTINWHGQLQVMTPFADGVVSMTQCAIEPGATLVYSFRASNAGTFWYHGLLHEQTTDGLFGLLQVLPLRGSDEDLARGLDLDAVDNEVVLFLSDYYNENAHDLMTLFYMTPLSGGAEPMPDAIVANGKPEGALYIDVRSRVSKTLVHVISAASLTMFTISVDGVNLILVEVDSTAIEPLLTPSVDLNAAQRVSFVIDWRTLSLPPGGTPGAGVYFRASAVMAQYPVDPATGYVPPYESGFAHPPSPLDPAFTAVFQFSPIAAGGPKQPDYAANGSIGSVPAAPPIAVFPPSSPYYGLNTSGGLDANVFDGVPAVALQTPTGTHQMYLEIAFMVDPKTSVVRGHFNSVSHSHYGAGGMMPTLFDKSVYGTPEGTASAYDPLDFAFAARKPFGYAPSGAPLPLMPIAYSSEAHYLLPPGAVITVLVNNTDKHEQPVHFHGHVLWLLATSETRPGDEQARFAAKSVMRRDTVSVPGKGWAKLAFVADNPGIWAAHGQIEWHIAGGLKLELYEGLSSLNGMPVPLAHQQNCKLPPPGAASWIVSNASFSDAGANATAVGAAACTGSAAYRPCTFLESNATGWRNATRCPCPLSAAASAGDGAGSGGGGPGPTRSFSLSITHLVKSQPLVPGAHKVHFAVNGMSPGPVLEAREGDWINVDVVNNLEEENTAVQFEGMDLVLTPFAAGVPTLSQCAILPGSSQRLGFRAARAGVYLYRGSHNLQDVDGLVGALIVRPLPGAPLAAQPPAANNEFVLLLGELFVSNALNAAQGYFLTPASRGVPPVPNAITVNGSLSGMLSFDAQARHHRTVLHLVGAQALSVLDVSVDGVALHVFAVDGTALAPPYLSLRSVAVAAGQRVSVLVRWGQLPPFTPARGAPPGQGVFLRVQARKSAYLVPNPSTWINPFDAHLQDIAPLNPECLVIVRFGGAPNVLPPYTSDSGAKPAPAGTLAAADINLLDARPALAAAPPVPTHELYLELGAAFDSSTNLTRGTVNGNSYVPQVDNAGGLVPVLWRYMVFGTADGGALQADASAFPNAARGSAAAAASAGAGPVGAQPPSQAVMFDLAKSHYLVPRGSVVAVFVNNTHARERPLRADGHTFFVLSTSELPGAEAAYAGAWLRRDVVSVPPRGWARLLFVADNPGVWHLGAAGAWHRANGETVKLFEALDGVAGLDVPPSDRAVCGMPLARLPAAEAAPAAPEPEAAAEPLRLSAGLLLATVLAPVMVLTLTGSFVMQKCGVVPAARGGLAPPVKVLPV
jgi:FtsP/CotA-like multicopper oxidase with cupredoxin domain